jgi:2-polyprenyl-6-methoxyphenol hydroxylase-like FAD-dependent oxidoreductase
VKLLFSNDPADRAHQTAHRPGLKSATPSLAVNQPRHQPIEGQERVLSGDTIPLGAGSTVAVLGGGPAGAFFAIQLLRQATTLGRRIRVVILERRHRAADPAAGTEIDCWKGCNHCAGGLSPRLVDVLRTLDLQLPEAIIQSRIRSLTIQGYWKNITVEVPAGREMFSAYRGTRPSRRHDRHQNLDGFLLQAAHDAGAEVLGVEVVGVRRSAAGKPQVVHHAGGSERILEADLLVIAAGVNGKPGLRAEDNPVFDAVRTLIPAFEPPRLRRALIFEMELEAGKAPWLDEEVYFVEYGSSSLPLEMCALIPKSGFMTAVLVGQAVDRAAKTSAWREVMNQFLDLPHIRKLVPPRTQLRLACTCAPNMVVGPARNPLGHRVAVIGDMAATRLYKDGILSAQQTAAALVQTVLNQGVDEASLRRGYGPAVGRFCRDNRFAAVVFLLHRVVFSSSILSRVLYQAVLTERKNRPAPDRTLEQILWKIASGDDRYEQVLRSMLQPAVGMSILSGGTFVTLRNYFIELTLGLHWTGLGRFTTGVALERLETKRATFAACLARFNLPTPSHYEFERMYTIKIRAPRSRVFDQLGRFGEPDRAYLHPRGVRIHRVAGAPNTPGCTIEYCVALPRFSFRLVLEQVINEHMAVYRVQNGFARGGVLIFELEKLGPDTCGLSIYVAFNFQRGASRLTHPMWWLVRRLFPAFVHDVIWNHSLCQLKDQVEEPHPAGGIHLEPVQSSTHHS